MHVIEGPSSFPSPRSGRTSHAGHWLLAIGLALAASASSGTAAVGRTTHSAARPGHARRAHPRSRLLARAAVAFVASSPWNSPIPADPVLDPRSGGIASYLGAEGRALADLYEYGTPVWEASAGDPCANVACTEPWGTCQLTQQLIQIPAGAGTASGSDSSMVVINGSTGYDFWNAHRNSTTSWSTGWGTRFSLTGSGTGGGATGAGVPLLAGLPRLWEMESGEIHHALGFITEDTCASVYRYPASKTDGHSSNSTCIPEGTRIQLDPSIDMNTIPGITPGEKIVARALQVYGAYCKDTGGAKLAFGFEDPVGKSNPYPGLGFRQRLLRHAPHPLARPARAQAVERRVGKSKPN